MIKSIFRYLCPCIGLFALYLALNLFRSQVSVKNHQYQLQNEDFSQKFLISQLSDLRLRDEYMEFIRNVNLGNSQKSHSYHSIFTKYFKGYLEPNRLLAYLFIRKKEYKKALNEVNIAIDNHPYFYVNYLLKSDIEKQLKIDFTQSLQTANQLQLRDKHFREAN
ncbi:MAG: hypothetical protein KC646_02940 [Candidatus Cloacimonetes bacterium]|nr:hypothetical protein [Candidatus Cloacimonadota bacterium]